ncbi:uncharacterized protein BYT42DRAFT_609654 [Radiomyces spectabilis]|uniref:uncharacterized protein n=1 Tax=Radiomyces spectabilis TaxID=64574 RepID=UPI00221F6A5B|nr:uncharacterized protein BYT42DRAFT_609654 [Radiomyces spectabilis]KAI8393890.1 hypothetical protein BYT42DRAFT_609654 [Radiomyces spectabilis]
MSPRDQSLEPTRYAIVRWFRFDQFVPERAVTSNFVSSKTLLWIRVPLALYSIIVFWADIIWNIQIGEFHRYFAYFTHLTFIGLHAYFMTTLYHHVRYLSASHRPLSFHQQPAILNYLYIYLYHTLVTFNIVTPVVYWALLSNDFLTATHTDPMDWWMTISLHALTFFMMLVDVVFNRMVLQIRIVLLIFANTLIYMCLTFIVHTINDWWVYSFLDWSQGPSAAIWYLAVATFVVLCFFLQMGIHALRDSIASRVVARPRRPSMLVSDLECAQTNKNFQPLESSIASQNCSAIH